MHEALWTALELEERYEELERRLTYTTETIKFALDVAKDNKTIQLERLIVYLITAELAISIMHTGVFTHLVSAAASFVTGA